MAMAKPGHFLRLIGSVVYSVLIFGGLLFLFAWRLDWWRAWVFVDVVAVATAATMFGVFRSRPDLLAERYGPVIQKGQPLADQVLTPLIGLSFFLLIAFIPIDVFHLHWLGGTSLPLAALGLALFVAGWGLLTWAMAVNAFAAPVVKHQAERGQVVVDTGPYAVVRHPMYAGAIPLMIGMPLWLDSVAGVLVAALPLAMLVVRVPIEERMLLQALPGYADYMAKVRWRLIPFVW
jgi:protein-S-isoprenylcysteine O-methyltransferase Ste14